MRLTEVHFRNVLNFESLDLKLSNLNLMVGANGSGKSNIIKVLRLISDRLNRPNQDIRTELDQIIRDRTKETIIVLKYQLTNKEFDQLFDGLKFHEIDPDINSKLIPLLTGCYTKEVVYQAIKSVGDIKEWSEDLLLPSSSNDIFEAIVKSSNQDIKSCLPDNYYLSEYDGFGYGILVQTITGFLNELGELKGESQYIGDDDIKGTLGSFSGTCKHSSSYINSIKTYHISKHTVSREENSFLISEDKEKSYSLYDHFEQLGTSYANHSNSIEYRYNNKSPSEVESDEDGSHYYVSSTNNYEMPSYNEMVKDYPLIIKYYPSIGYNLSSFNNRYYSYNIVEYKDNPSNDKNIKLYIATRCPCMIEFDYDILSSKHTGTKLYDQISYIISRIMNNRNIKTPRDVSYSIKYLITNVIGNKLINFLGQIRIILQHEITLWAQYEFKIHQLLNKDDGPDRVRGQGILKQFTRFFPEKKIRHKNQLTSNIITLTTDMNGEPSNQTLLVSSIPDGVTNLSLHSTRLQINPNKNAINKIWYDSKYLSGGEKEALIILYIISEIEQISTLIMDEPLSGAHSSLITDIINQLVKHQKDQKDQKDRTIMIATHRVEFLNKETAKSIKYLDTSNPSETVMTSIDHSWYSFLYINPIIFSRRILYVEGDTDRFFLNLVEMETEILGDGWIRNFDVFIMNHGNKPGNGGKSGLPDCRDKAIKLNIVNKAVLDFDFILDIKALLSNCLNIAANNSKQNNHTESMKLIIGKLRQQFEEEKKLINKDEPNEHEIKLMKENIKSNWSGKSNYEVRKFFKSLFKDKHGNYDEYNSLNPSDLKDYFFMGKYHNIYIKYVPINNNIGEKRGREPSLEEFIENLIEVLSTDEKLFVWNYDIEFLVDLTNKSDWFNYDKRDEIVDKLRQIPLADPSTNSILKERRSEMQRFIKFMRSYAQLE